MPEPMTNAPSREVRFPKMMRGLVFSVLAYALMIGSASTHAELVTLKPFFKIENPLYFFSLFLYICAFIYLFVCLYQLHDILRQVTQNHYPISPAKAVGFNFIPIFNLYWLFKWPLEIVNFINVVDKRKKVLNWLPGLLIVVGAVLGQGHNAGIELVVGFSVLAYLSKKVEQAIRKEDAAIQDYISNYKPSRSYAIVILLCCFITLFVVGLIAAIAIPAMHRMKTFSKEKMAENERLRLEQEQAEGEFEETENSIPAEVEDSVPESQTY